MRWHKPLSAIMYAAQCCLRFQPSARPHKRVLTERAAVPRHDVHCAAMNDYRVTKALMLVATQARHIAALATAVPALAAEVPAAQWTHLTENDSGGPHNDVAAGADDLEPWLLQLDPHSIDVLRALELKAVDAQLHSNVLDAVQSCGSSPEPYSMAGKPWPSVCANGSCARDAELRADLLALLLAQPTRAQAWRAVQSVCAHELACAKVCDRLANIRTVCVQPMYMASTQRIVLISTT